MDTLPASLTTHQRGTARRPALTLSVRNQRFTRPRFNWTRHYDGTEPNDIIAATLTPTGALVSAHNDNGTVRVRSLADPLTASPTDWSDWHATFTGTAGAGVALAAVPNETILVYVTNGDRLRYHYSSNDGQTWPSFGDILTETSNISWIALGADPATGNLVLFYVLSGTTTLKHVRRTSGSWDSSGTEWNQGGNYASITGIAASRASGDQHLIITGTEDGTGDQVATGITMGDGAFPPGFWGAPSVFFRLDSGSTVTLNGPSIAHPLGDAAATFGWNESGDVEERRAFFTNAESLMATTDTWLEPFPTPAWNTHGAALTSDDQEHAWLITPSGAWHSAIGGAADYSDQLLAADWTYTPTGTRASFVLDWTTPPQAGALFPAPGLDLTLSAGYHSGPDRAAQTGQVRRFHIQSTRLSFTRDGRRTLTITATGPWEQLDSWRAPVPYHIPAGEMTRQELYRFFVGRAGVSPEGSGGTEWFSQEPGFSLSPGESARTALLRILAPTRVLIRPESGATEALEPPETAEETYGEGNHPIHAAHRIEEAPGANWYRIQAEDRYADAHDFDSLTAHGPRFRVLRQLAATTNTIAQQFAADTLERHLLTRPLAEITAPFHAGQRLWDVVTVTVPELDLDTDARVVAIANTYRRGPQPARYDTTLTLAAIT